MFRTAITARIPALSAARAFHYTPAAAESAAEKVKKTAKDVNIKVGQTLAAGIEKGEKATQATKETLGVKTEQAKQGAKEDADLVGQKANQAAAGARVAKEDFKNEVKK
ncbi:hypothetical protein PUNSTDRAFT_58405 [Punctularia strigosozonata HHB-11173 SS5]|uniref:uncharacterized protein n=1 Tax=Punctularia strigosozonata (strain HHB-11173) TaxID=741275 RepID=UPI000441825F|nr:uncharacterized protein PUNSTDRAFT_58405 [Punctularia strigosozonata HHB-11173 SS5]EIN13429.1 hypothetical protein PUNSTDRAFT_58405 [Punctularia strigosozonata HHB-11173 SS5]